MKVLIVGGISRSLVQFRGQLIQAILAAGHNVTCVAGERDVVAEQTLMAWGATFAPIRLTRAGMRPWKDLTTFIDLTCLIRRVRPDIVLTYTIKPVVWGGLAARIVGVSATYSLITGLGYAFMEANNAQQKLAALIARFLYRRSLPYSRVVFFQNPDDAKLFGDLRLVRKEQTYLLNGSGVDVKHYAVAPLPSRVVFLLIGRLLADKGVREYVEAARMLLARRKPSNVPSRVRERIAPGLNRLGNVGVADCEPEISFLLVGALDPNPSSVTKSELDEWAKDIVDYRGELADVRSVLEESSVYVLPSYREGTPRTVLEAMSMGRPIITADSPGCRETVRLTAAGLKQKMNGSSVMEGENGFLVRPRDAQAVAEAMRRFCDDPELIGRMGRRSREIAVEQYDVRKVNAMMLEAMAL